MHSIYLTSSGSDGRVSPYVRTHIKVVSSSCLASWQKSLVLVYCLPSMNHLASALVMAAGPEVLWKRLSLSTHLFVFAQVVFGGCILVVIQDVPLLRALVNDGDGGGIVILFIS